MIGIIGIGNMGRAIALGIRKKVLVSDNDRKKLHFKKKSGIVACRDNVELAKRSEIIILAVKPQAISEVLPQIKPYSKGKLIISIAAGIRTALIEKILGRARVVRVMPNMPAVVGKGISAIAPGRFAGKKDIKLTREIFSNLGEVVLLKEAQMDAVTALSGSGPAYYFLFTDILSRSGKAIGLSRRVAEKLAVATFIGASGAASCADISMKDFVKKVASKGGTTEAALKVFKQKGLEDIVKCAVIAARDRSRDLASG